MTKKTMNIYADGLNIFSAVFCTLALIPSWLVPQLENLNELFISFFVVLLSCQVILLRAGR